MKIENFFMIGFCFLLIIGSVQIVSNLDKNLNQVNYSKLIK